MLNKINVKLMLNKISFVDAIIINRAKKLDAIFGIAMSHDSRYGARL